MADSPFISDDPLEGQPPLNPVAQALVAARNWVGENKDVPPPAFFMDPRSLSLRNMAHGGLDTMAHWAQGATDPSAIRAQDAAAPVGAGAIAAMPFRQTPDRLNAFIGPTQVRRLEDAGDITAGNRGSLGALERAQETWAKGGMDKDALAETWAKEGWAPPESFGVRGSPFSWLEMPELRMRDDLMREHQSLGQLARVDSAGKLPDMYEANADLSRLMRAAPEAGDFDVKFITSPGASSAQAIAGRRGDNLLPHQIIPPHTYIGAGGPKPTLNESIMTGHELRGHAIPRLGDTQLRTFGEHTTPRLGQYDTRAHQLIEEERQRARGASADAYSNPDLSMADRLRASRYVDRLREMQDEAAMHAAYFAQPHERMARHAQTLQEIERMGGSPFAPDNAPGVMSTYGPLSLGRGGTIDDVISNKNLYTMDDLRLPYGPEAAIRPAD